ncbi:MAG: CRTAC1 family protein [Rhodothermales bacterium]|nr:CRTAC1 family protein [Rhodothermales bacterium]
MTTALCLALVACGQNQSPSERPTSADARGAPTEEGAYFVDVTEYVGIDFQHSVGDEELSNIIETVGSGAAFLDYDQDGYIDLYVVSGASKDGVTDGPPPSFVPGNRLFRNIDGIRFEDVTDRAGVADEDGFGMGLAVGDYDNDGYPDIYVGNYGANVLYHNNGDGTFSDVADRAGVAGAGDLCTVGAVWLDYDNDGLLDLYVGNYLEFDPDYEFFYEPDGFPPPMAYSGQPDALYHNRGDGTFEDVTEAAGVLRPEGRMMGVGAADVDDDGFMDIYVANDVMENYLWHNEGGTHFVEMGLPAGVAYSERGDETSSMSVNFADFNGDGLMDLFVSDIHFSALYRNHGDGIFEDVTVRAGVAMPSGQYDGWGAAFLDYDLDGDADILKVNGDMNHLFGQEDQVFKNTGDGKFIDVSLELGRYFFREEVGRGASVGDYDNDGDPDIFIVNLNSKGILLRNESLDGNEWLQVLLVGTVSNRDGVGARVTLAVGGRTLTAHKQSSSGYLSQHDPRLHFGLGQSEVVDRLEVRWPSGSVQVLENVEAGQVVTITEPGSRES